MGSPRLKTYNRQIYHPITAHKALRCEQYQENQNQLLR
jgi:hypothetical protein